MESLPPTAPDEKDILERLSQQLQHMRDSLINVSLLLEDLRFELDSPARAEAGKLAGQVFSQRE